MKGQRAFLPVVLAVYLVLSVVTLVRHEMWRDEMHCWNLARESDSLSDLFRNIRYDGHACLWRLLLLALSRFWASPLAMRVLHLAIASAAAGLLLGFAPFPRWQRALFVFGYFPFYEYAAICRHYGLEMLLLFGFCCLFARRPRPVLGLSGILFLLCQTTAYGVILAVALALTLVFEAASQGPERGAAPKPWGRLALGMALVGLGAALGVLQIMPPADTGAVVGWNFSVDLRHLADTLGTALKGLVPIQPPGLDSWGRNLLDFHVMGRWVQAGLAAALLAAGAMSFARKPGLLLLFALGTAGLLGFGYVKFPGYVRHHGHFFLLLTVCLWMYPHARAWTVRWAPAAELESWWTSRRPVWFSALLAVHLCAGARATLMDWRHAFSAAEEAARYIREHGLADCLLVGQRDTVASGVCGRLGRACYFPSGNRWGRFVIFDNRRLAISGAEVVAQARSLVEAEGKDALIIYSPPDRLRGEGVTLLACFSDCIVRSETVALYRVRPKPTDL